MRFYGLHSGRNNISRLLARSIMYNSNHNKSSMKTNYTVSSENAIDYVIKIIITIAIFYFVFHW
jgi:hypothetical protein